MDEYTMTVTVKNKGVILQYSIFAENAYKGLTTLEDRLSDMVRDYFMGFAQTAKEIKTDELVYVQIPLGEGAR